MLVPESCAMPIEDFRAVIMDFVMATKADTQVSTANTSFSLFVSHFAAPVHVGHMKRVVPVWFNAEHFNIF